MDTEDITCNNICNRPATRPIQLSWWVEGEKRKEKGGKAAAFKCLEEKKGEKGKIE